MSKLLHSEQQLLRDWSVQVRQLFNKRLDNQRRRAEIANNNLKGERDVTTR